VNAQPSPRDFAVELPPGWVRLPVDERSDAEIARVVAPRFPALPPREREAARRLVRRDLAESVRAAAAVGGLDVLLCVDPAHGRPVAATCTFTYVPAPNGGAPSAADLLPLLAPDAARDVTTSLAPAGGGTAVRRRYHREAESGGVSTHVEYVVAMPGSGAHLLVSFSTAAGPDADALVVVFDEIASSLRWVW
jgi:hypothetical protein